MGEDPPPHSTFRSVLGPPLSKTLDPPLNGRVCPSISRKEGMGATSRILVEVKNRGEETWHYSGMDLVQNTFCILVFFWGKPGGLTSQRIIRIQVNQLRRLV